MTDAPAGATVRLFVALELPAEARVELWRWGTAAAVQTAGLRALPAASLHVTMCFLGSRPAAASATVADVCRSVAGTGAVSLACAQAIWLPERRPHVLAITLVDDAKLVTALQARLASALYDAGWYEPEHRPFLPHVTVARVTHGTRSRQRACPPVPAIAFRATSVALMRSHLGSEGPIYEPLAQISLEGT